MFNLTPSILTKVAPGIFGQRAVDISRQLTEICPKYGIDTADKLHEFIANVLHESANFTILSESLNYSVHGLLSTFSRARISAADAERFGRKSGQTANQQAIANTLYGGSFGRINLGNIKPGDGWTFRGAGPIQITGRGNVTNFTNYFNSLTGSRYSPEQMADLLRRDITVGIHSACWIFAIAKKLIDEAESDNMREVVKKINGGFIGMPERMRYYEAAKQFISEN